MHFGVTKKVGEMLRSRTTVFYFRNFTKGTPWTYEQVSFCATNSYFFLIDGFSKVRYLGVHKLIAA